MASKFNFVLLTKIYSFLIFNIVDLILLEKKTSQKKKLTNLPTLSTIKIYTSHFPFPLDCLFRRQINNYSAKKFNSYLKEITIFLFSIYLIEYYWGTKATHKNKYWQIYLGYLQLKNIRTTSHFDYSIMYVRLIICFNIYLILSLKNI